MQRLGFNRWMGLLCRLIANFTSAIWQVHAFGEGNTRTTAVFIQKYLNYMGFDVDNSLFLENSLYYRKRLKIFFEFLFNITLIFHYKDASFNSF